jgi:hypothetical protein
MPHRRILTPAERAALLLSGQWSHARSGRDHSLEYGLFEPRDSGPESTRFVGRRQPARTPVELTRSEP